MINFPLPRIDKDKKLQSFLLPHCRLKSGDIWEDEEKRHKIYCGSATDDEIIEIIGKEKAALAIHDPPYNFIAFNKMSGADYADWSRKWIDISDMSLKKNSSLYIWLGSDHRNHFQPLPEFMIMMRDTKFTSRNLITLRNQRGYGTQKNWMSVRQELLYYEKGKPEFNPGKTYTNIPKILNGYYKEIAGEVTKNFERSKSQFIRAGNVWVDIQQVFYRMEENVNGCYAQKPLKAIERIIEVSSKKNDLVIDFFSHAGTTLVAAEKTGRKCFTVDIDPIYCEITIRRFEHLKKYGTTGWQNSNPFAEEILSSKKFINYLKSKYKIDYKEDK